MLNSLNMLYGLPQSFKVYTNPICVVKTTTLKGIYYNNWCQLYDDNFTITTYGRNAIGIVR